MDTREDENNNVLRLGFSKEVPYKLNKKMLICEDNPRCEFKRNTLGLIEAILENSVKQYDLGENRDKHQGVIVACDTLLKHLKWDNGLE